MLLYQTSATSTAALLSSGTALAAANQAQFLSSAGEGRVIAGGLRLTTAMGTSTTPGFIWAGNPAPSTYTQFSANEIVDIINYPGTEVSNAFNGITVCLRPVDPDSFTFQQAVVDGNGWNTGTTNLATTMPVTVPSIIWGTLPTGTTYIEGVLHIEVTPIVARAQISLLSSIGNKLGETLSDYFPSVETVYKIVSSVLPPSVSPGVGYTNKGLPSQILSGVGALMAGRATPANMRLRGFGSL